MPKLPRGAITDVQDAYDKYENAVSNGKGLSPQTKDTYLQHVRRFIRWLKDEPMEWDQTSE